MDQLVRSGKVVSIGASTHPAWFLMKSLATSDRLGTLRHRAVPLQPVGPPHRERAAPPLPAERTCDAAVVAAGGGNPHRTIRGAGRGTTRLSRGDPRAAAPASHRGCVRRSGQGVGTGIGGWPHQDSSRSCGFATGLASPAPSSGRGRRSSSTRHSRPRHSPHSNPRWMSSTCSFHQAPTWPTSSTPGGGWAAPACGRDESQASTPHLPTHALALSAQSQQLLRVLAANLFPVLFGQPDALGKVELGPIRAAEVVAVQQSIGTDDLGDRPPHRGATG